MGLEVTGEKWLIEYKTPVGDAETFGYTSKGGSSETLVADQIRGSHFTVSKDALPTAIKVYLKQLPLYNPTVKCAIYRLSDGVLMAETEEWQVTDGWDDWKSFSISTVYENLSANETYILVVWADIPVTWYYASEAMKGRFALHTYNNFPSQANFNYSVNYKYSVYCEYTPIDWVALAATEPKIMEELNGHEEATFKLRNTAANRAIVAEDRDVRISYDDVVIYEGVLGAVEYYSEELKCIVYNDTYETMKKRIIDGTYIAKTLSNLLTSICDAAEVSAGTCPAGTASVRFEKTLCFDAARFLATLAQADYWAEGGTFNIGVRDNCVLCLPFEENMGTVTADLSGYGNNGVINGASWVDGKYGKALSLNGTTNYVQCEPVTLDDGWSFAGWFKISSDNTGTKFILINYEPVKGFALALVDAITEMRVYCAEGYDGVQYSAVDLRDDIWHFIVGTLSAKSIGAAMTLYVDGVNVASDVTIYLPIPSTANFLIGQYGSSSWYKGMVDEVRVFNRALTADEVEFLYNVGLGRVSSRKIDRFKQRDKILVKGIDESGDTIWGEAGTGEDIAVFREKKATNETTLDLTAADKLAEINTDTNQIQVHLKPQHGALLRSGDIIPVVSDKMAIESNHRIYRITKIPEEVIVQPERLFKTTEDVLLELRSFEELGIIVNPTLTPSDNARWSNDAERIGTATSYTKIKEIMLGADLNGTVRIKFDLKAEQLGTATGAAYARIYRNGTALGTECATTSATYGTYSADLNTSWVAGGSMQIYAKRDYTPDYGVDAAAYIRNMRICYDPTFEPAHTNNDP